MLEKMEELRKELKEQYKQGTLKDDDEWIFSALNRIKEYEHQLRYDFLTQEQLIFKLERIQELCLIIGKDKF